VLYSHVFTVDAHNRQTALFNINLAMRHHCRYNGAANTDIQKGGLYICAACDEPGAAELMPSIAGEHRLSYHDN